MTKQKPIIFISSTIKDFKDLRSALKYNLELLGYEVMLSEYNDFTKPLDENTYQACLKALERATHYILLIGSRTGGYINLDEKITITRSEYRTAYNLFRAGRMKLVVFVRDELWNIREDRKALSDVLNRDYVLERELTSDQALHLSTHSSALINNAEATFSFIDEVAKTDEMELGIQGKGEFPRGNWIHSFSSFQDIIDTLKVVFNFGTSLTKAALTLNLRRELLSNLTQLTYKYDGQVFSRTSWALGVWNKRASKSTDVSTVTGRELQRLGVYLIFKCNARRLSFQFLDSALSSGEFLHYDFAENRYNSGIIHEGLFSLKENIEHLKGLDAIYRDKVVQMIERYTPRNNSALRTDEEFTVENDELLMPLAFLSCEMNIENLCTGIFKALNDDRTMLEHLKLFPRNPFPEEAERMESELTTTHDVETWLVCKNKSACRRVWLYEGPYKIADFPYICYFIMFRHL